MTPQVLLAFQEVWDKIKEHPDDYAKILQEVSRKLYLRSHETELLIKHTAHNDAVFILPNYK
jgi:ABC-type nitrate/sulfonate/bicarbonate transport system substrate-binding protein